MVQIAERALAQGISQKDNLKERVVSAAKRRFMPGIIERSTRELFHRSGYEHIALLKEPLDEGNVLLIAMAHESLGDLGPAVDVFKEVRVKFPQIEGGKYILAKSIQSGKQGEYTKSGFQTLAQRLLERNNIDPLFVTSTNDIERGEIPTAEEAEEFVLALKNPKRAVLLHPQANMEAGRINKETGKRNDAGPIDKNVAKVIANRIRRNTPIVVLPVGLYGSARLYDPTERKITKEGKNLIKDTEVARLIGDPNMLPEKIGFIKVERPYLLSDLNAYADPIQEFMQRIVIGIPPENRGIYIDALRGKR